MEIEIGPSRNPALLKSLKECLAHSPFTLYAELEMLHGELKRSHEWPALTTVQPEDNTTSEGSSEHTKLNNGLKYSKWGLEYHLENYLDYLDRNKDRSKEHSTNTTSESRRTHTTSDSDSKVLSLTSVENMSTINTNSVLAPANI